MTSQNTFGRFATLSIGALVAGCFSMQVLAADETTIQVLKEPGRPAQSKSYMAHRKHSCDFTY